MADADDHADGNRHQAPEEIRGAASREITESGAPRLMVDHRQIAVPRAVLRPSCDILGDREPAIWAL